MARALTWINVGLRSTLVLSTRPGCGVGEEENPRILFTHALFKLEAVALCYKGLGTAKR